MSKQSITYQINEEILARLAGDLVVLFHPETERILTLNECGTRIWQLLGECPSAPEIVSRLTQQFSAPEPLIQQEVEGFLAQLETERLIRRQV